MRRLAMVIAAKRSGEMAPARAVSLTEFLRALAHPLRLRIVALLCQGNARVNDLSRRLAAPQPIVSQQLRILRMSRLVEVSRGKGHAVYRIAEPRLRRLLHCIEGCSAGQAGDPGGRPIRSAR